VSPDQRFVADLLRPSVDQRNHVLLGEGSHVPFLQVEMQIFKWKCKKSADRVDRRISGIGLLLGNDLGHRAVVAERPALSGWHVAGGDSFFG
jgi:hypothetical protein